MLQCSSSSSGLASRRANLPTAEEEIRVDLRNPLGRGVEVLFSAKGQEPRANRCLLPKSFLSIAKSFQFNNLGVVRTGKTFSCHFPAVLLIFIFNSLEGIQEKRFVSQPSFIGTFRREPKCCPVTCHLWPVTCTVASSASVQKMRIYKPLFFSRLRRAIFERGDTPPLL